jgi:hypothetical protein
VLLSPQASPVRSRSPAREAMAVRVKAAVLEDPLGALGVRLGDSARSGRARGRCGDRGGLGGSLFPSLGGCGGDWGQQQDRRCTHVFRAPPAPRSAQHCPGSFFRWGTRAGHPKPRWSSKFLGVSALSHTPGSYKRELPELPRVKKREVEDAAGGSAGRRGSGAPPGAAASEVSALTLPPLGLNCLWVSPAVPEAPSFLPLQAWPGIT